MSNGWDGAGDTGSGVGLGAVCSLPADVMLLVGASDLGSFCFCLSGGTSMDKRNYINFVKCMETQQDEVLYSTLVVGIKVG